MLEYESAETHKVIFSKAKKNNLADLVAELQLSLAKYYKEHEINENALHYFEALCMNRSAPERVKLEAELGKIDILENSDQQEAITARLTEMEDKAASSGYIGIAALAAHILGKLQLRQGRIDLYEECGCRLEGYRRKLLTGIPKGFKADRYRERLILPGLDNQSTSSEKTVSGVDPATAIAGI